MNDTFYKKTGHLKPYSRLPNLLTYLTMEQSKQKLSKNFLQFIIVHIVKSLCKPILFFLVLPKIFPALYKTFTGVLLAAISSNFLALPITLGTDHIVVAKAANQSFHFHAKAAEQSLHSHLTIESPKQIVVWSDRNEVVIANLPDNIAEIRSLSDMRLKSKRSLHTIPAIYLPRANKQKKEKDGLTYKLANGKIDIYLSNYDYSPPNFLLKNDYCSKNKLRSLSTPTNIISFDVSENKSILVALDQKGFLHKLELQNRPSLHEVMNRE